MKKCIFIFSIFLFISFNMNIMTAIAVPDSQAYSRGFYTINDLKLMENVVYSVQNISSNGQSFIMILDGNELILQLQRVEPNSTKYCLRPLKNDYSIIIYGNGKVVFS